MNIIDIAREAGASAYTNRHYPDQPYLTFSPEKLKAFATAIKAAHLAELAGVEMPEPVAYKTDDIELYVKEKKNCAYSIPLVTLDQCQQAVATAVARKDAELETERLRLAACGVAALGYFEGCKDEYKSASLEDVLQLNKKVAALTAERDALREATKECVKALTVDASGKRLYPESRMKALVMVEALEATK